MKGSTHALIGAAGTVVLLRVLHVPAPTLPGIDPTIAGYMQTAVAASFATFAALLPDIDEPNATISRLGTLKAGPLRFRPLWALSAGIKSLFGHRTMTHSLYAVLLMAVLAWFWITVGQVAAGIALVWGYGSHILGDMATYSGVPLLWPHTTRSFHLLPPGLRFRTASAAEWLVVGAVLLTTGWVLALSQGG